MKPKERKFETGVRVLNAVKLDRAVNRWLAGGTGKKRTFHTLQGLTASAGVVMHTGTLKRLLAGVSSKTDVQALHSLLSVIEVSFVEVSDSLDCVS